MAVGHFRIPVRPLERDVKVIEDDPATPEREDELAAARSTVNGVSATYEPRASDVGMLPASHGDL